MRKKLRDIFLAAVIGTGALGAGYGAYIIGDVTANEYYTQRANFDAAKICVSDIRVHKDCTKEDISKVVAYLDNEKKFGEGTVLFFSSLVALNGAVAARRPPKP